MVLARMFFMLPAWRTPASRRLRRRPGRLQLKRKASRRGSCQRGGGRERIQCCCREAYTSIIGGLPVAPVSSAACAVTTETIWVSRGRELGQQVGAPERLLEGRAEKAEVPDAARADVGGAQALHGARRVDVEAVDRLGVARRHEFVVLEGERDDRRAHRGVLR